MLIIPTVNFMHTYTHSHTHTYDAHFLYNFLLKYLYTKLFFLALLKCGLKIYSRISAIFKFNTKKILIFLHKQVAILL